MIAASEPQEFIPFGRQQVLDHPGAIQIGIQQHQYQSENALSKRLSQVSITDSSKKSEFWLLRETINENTECEEELYYAGKTVVWSVGPSVTDNKNNRILKCCYTCETPVKQALWCNFHLSKPEISSPYLQDSENFKQIDVNGKGSKKNDDLRNCICIMDSNSIKFYSKSGKEYLAALQFKVHKIWPIKYGLILERDLEKKDSVEGVGEYDNMRGDFSFLSPHSCMSFRNISMSVPRPSCDQSFLVNQKNFTDLGDRSTFNSTQYMNLPQNIPEVSSSMNFAVSTATSSLEDNGSLPVVFSLSHPLDEICPVVCKEDTLSYVSNPDVKIVFTSEEPSLCMTYNKRTKIHSIYFLRKAQPQESEICLQRESMLSRTSRTHQSVNTTGKPGFSNSASSSFNLQTNPENLSLPAFLSAKTRKSLGLSHNVFPNVINSPFMTFERTRHSSPIPSRNTLSPAFSHNFYTPSPKRTDSSLNSPHGGTPSRIESRMMTEDIEYAEPKPLYPQVCLQHLWTETPLSDNSELSLQADKAFLTKDICGQSYLCYLTKSKNLLNFVKIKKNKKDGYIIFSEKGVVNARDACELVSLDMIAIIGLDGGVELYSGTTHVAKILLSGVPSCVATSSYLSDSNAGPTFFKHTSLGGFPKRSSLLPQSILSQSHHSPVFNDSLSQLSPVTAFESTSCDKLTPNVSVKTSAPREGTLTALKDSVASRISLEFSTGILFRLELPNFGNSPLVKSCLNALNQVLPNELFMKLAIKWYCTRNVPGCHSIDAEEEWSMFTDVLFDLMGYDVELLKGTKLDIEKSPVIRAKKQKKCERSGDEDWNYLIGSKHHELCLNQTRHILGLGHMGTNTDMQTDFESCGITETPSIPSRGSFESRYDSFDASWTPVDKSRFHGGKLKSSFSKLQDRSSLESIDETPLQPKSSFSKSKLTTSRFKICLDQGDVSPILPVETPQRILDEHVYVNKKGPLYSFASWILFSLHLLYEDMKLNQLKKRFLPYLAKMLHRLACDLDLSEYVHHYWLDFPNKCPFTESDSGDSSRVRIESNFPSCFVKNPPNIFQHFYDMLLKKKVEPYPFFFKINNRTGDLIQLIGLLSYGYENPGISLDCLVKNVQIGKIEKQADRGKSPRSRSHRPIPHRVIQLMIQKGITQDSMQTLPPGVSLILFEALYSCRDYPGFGWSKEAYKLAMRHDLASFCRQNSKEEVGPTNELIMPSAANNSKSNSAIRTNMDLEEDGMEDLTNMDVLKLRFSTDQRVLEARRMLQSAQPVRITIQQRPDVSDHEFIQEQEKHLYAICLRTMALPVGRGMMTVRTASPVVTEKLPIPPLCLNGRVPPTDKVVDMSHIEVATNMNVWPLFHNGVAAGLRISPNASDIDSQWIIYNKPKTNNDELIEHAGFLMALGLNGHLSNLQDTSIFHYLIKFHEMTSVGLLLGISASKRGTMDPYMVRIVSLHIEAMLPPTGIEIDVDVVVEPAALVSLGFLYQGTAQRHIAQVLLQEIGRPPGPEMANSIDRESYSLAAGLALGLVVFGRGAKLCGLGDMGIADTLHHYMVGGPKRPYLGSQREKYSTPSFLIWEGDLVNTHVTGPGAVLALGMLYFNTGNRAIAEWLKAPETQHLLEVVLPDALLLRTLAKGLILWEDIEPTESWIMSHVPEFIRPYVLVKPEINNDKSIDYETMDQAYCNIVAGACMAIGLRFAGSGCDEAFETLLSYAKMFTSLLGKNIGELCGKSTIETCLNVVTVSLAMVMAGTGDIEVLRLCRYLRSRVGPTNTVVTYGSHLATHMAIGLLFLGGGAYTLSTSPEAIAALLCAFYPKWPIHSNDNRYHLQAFRHLYVLAIEARLLLPRDIDTRTLCYAHITCVYLDMSPNKEKELKLRAPCLLPELKKLKEVRIDDNRYWSIVFNREKNWEDFTNILSECSFVDVKQKAGCLSYLEDPQGFRSLLAQTLTSEDVIPWTIRVETIFGFSSDPILVNFTQYFLEGRENESNESIEDKMVIWLTYIAYYCLTKDKLSLLPVWVSLLKAGQNVFFNASSVDLWQLKLMWTQALRCSGSNNSTCLIPADMVLSTKQFCQKCFESWEPSINGLLRDYIRNKLDHNSKDQDKLATYLLFYDIPRLDCFSGNVPEDADGPTIVRICNNENSRDTENITDNGSQKVTRRGEKRQAFGGFPAGKKIEPSVQECRACIAQDDVINVQRYVLWRAKCMSRSFCFLDGLKGNTKNFCVKSPKDDPTKPPLRLNIPNDSEKNTTEEPTSPKHRDSPQIHKKDAQQPRSKSLLSHPVNKHPLAKAYDEDYVALPKTESDMQITHGYGTEITQSQHDGPQRKQQASDHVPHKRTETEDVARAAKSLTQPPIKDTIQQSAVDKKHEIKAHSIGEKIDSVKLETQQATLDNKNEQKALYIIIDVPERQSVEDSGTSSNLETLKVDYDTLKKLSSESGSNSKVAKIDSKGAKGGSSSHIKGSQRAVKSKSEPKIRFQVHEIDEAATYVFELKFKKNLGGKSLAVGCVPEKELKMRSENLSEEEARLRGLGSLSGSNRTYKGPGKEITMVEDKTEPVKYENKSQKTDSSHVGRKGSFHSVKSQSHSSLGSARVKGDLKKDVGKKKGSEKAAAKIDGVESSPKGDGKSQKKDHPLVKPSKETFVPQTESMKKVSEEVVPEQDVIQPTVQTHSKRVESVAADTSPKAEDALNRGVPANETNPQQYSAKTNSQDSIPTDQNQYHYQYKVQEDGQYAHSYYYPENYQQPPASSPEQQPHQDTEEKEYYYYHVQKDPQQQVTASDNQIPDIDHPTEAAQKPLKNIIDYNRSSTKRKNPHKGEPKPGGSRGGKNVKFSDSRGDSYRGDPPRKPTEFQTSASVVKISSESPPYPRFCAAYPPNVNEVMVNDRRRFGIRPRDRFFRPETRNFERKDAENKSNMDELSENSILFPKTDTSNFDCSSLFICKKTDVLSVLGPEDNTPKISDNMVNVTNESIVETKTEPSLDSLSMMKKVKEIVDFDLKNAVKIFNETNQIEVSSVIVSKGSAWQVDEEALRRCIANRKALLSREIHGDFPLGNDIKGKEGGIDNDLRMPPKFLPGKRESGEGVKVSGKTFNSVVRFNENYGNFQVDQSELEEAVSQSGERFQELYLTSITPIIQTGLQNADDRVNDSRKTSTLEAKGGDSILVFDELTQTWRVDFSILEKREEQMRHEEELTKRSELILETIEKLEKGNVSTIPKPNSRDKKIFDYTSEEWKAYKPEESSISQEKKSTKNKFPFKESDAEEIRKKNSDLYENLFVVNKKETKVKKNGKQAPGLNTSHTKKETAGKVPVLAKDINTDVPPKGSDKPPQKDEQTIKPTQKKDDNYWETYLKTNVLPFDRPEQPRPTRPPPPPPSLPPVPPSSIIEKPPDVPKMKMPPPGRPQKIEEPKHKFPLPLGRKEKINETNAHVPPPSPKDKKTDLTDKKSPPPKPEPAPPATAKKIYIPKKPLKTPAASKQAPPPPNISKKETPTVKPPSPRKPSPSTKPAPPASKQDPLKTGTIQKKTPTSTQTPLKKNTPIQKTDTVEKPKRIPIDIQRMNLPIPTRTPPPEPQKPIIPPSSPIPPTEKTPPPQVPPSTPSQTKQPDPPTNSTPKTPSTPSKDQPSSPQPIVDPRQKSPPTIGAPPTNQPKTTPLKDSPSSKTDLKTSSLPNPDKKHKPPSDHYISENILEMFKNSAKDVSSKPIPNKVETVKVNLTPDKRMPSKITEINLNKKCDETATKPSKPSHAPHKKTPNSPTDTKFYKNFEKYKTPFSDPEYEEKYTKINSDIESNPNLKKLDTWNKTLVLHDAAKPPENIEAWLKDETDKMATLLLKVLQEAAEGKPRKKSASLKSKSSNPDRTSSNNPNPYDNIRKKQETSSETFLFKLRSVNVALEPDRKPKTSDLPNPLTPKNNSPTRNNPSNPQKTPKTSPLLDILNISADKSAIYPSNPPNKALFADPKPKLTELFDPQTVSEITDDIPGPEILKRISSTWKLFPVLGCQLTIFSLLRLYQLLNLSTSVFGSGNVDKSKRRAFSRLFAKYGPIVNLQGPLSGNVILIHKPEHLAAVFDQDSTSPVRSVFDSLDQSRREMEEKALLSTIPNDWTKPEWINLRKVYHDPAAKDPDKYLEPVEIAADCLVNSIRRNRNSQNFASENFMEDIRRWSLEGLCNVFFARSFGFLETRTRSVNWLLEPDKLFMAVQDATEYLSKCEKGFQFWRLMMTPSLLSLAQTYRTLSTIIGKQLCQAELSLRHKNEQIKEGVLVNVTDLTYIESAMLFDNLTPEEITCSLVDALLVGTNALSISLGFLLYRLAQNGKAQQRLLKEVKEILPGKTSRLDYGKLQSSRYLQACLKESMRLNTPFPLFFRLLQNDILLSNYVVPKGTYVVMDSRASSMREQVFEEADKFIPERWITEDKWMQRWHPFPSFPLCHGPRSDLAKRIVEMQVCSCVAKIIRNYQIEYHFGDVSGTESVFSYPDKPLKFTFIERTD